MKNLYESILDDEEDLIQGTDIINKNFPSKQDIKKEKTWSTNYFYQWTDPELFKTLYKDVAIKKKITPLETIQVQTAYDPNAFQSPNQDYVFIFKLVGGYSEMHTYFIDYSKSLNEALDVIYRVLTIVKDNPKALKFINIYIKKNKPMPTELFFKKFK